MGRLTILNPYSRSLLPTFIDAQQQLWYYRRN